MLIPQHREAHRHLRPRVRAPISWRAACSMAGMTSRFEVVSPRHAASGECTLQIPGPAQRAQRAGRDRVGLDLEIPFADHPEGAGRLRRRAASVPGPRHRGRRHGGRRLRPPSGRDPGDAGRRQGRVRRAGSSRCSSRTATRARSTCAQEFLTAFNQADVLVVMDIYAAGEAPIPGRHAPRTSPRASAPTATATSPISAATGRASLDHVCEISRPGDLVLTLGAGDVSQLGPEHAAPARGRLVEWEGDMLGEIRGEVRFKEPLSFHTSLRIGGAAGHLRGAAGRRRHPPRAACSPSASSCRWPSSEAATTCSSSDRGMRGVVLKLEGCLGRAEFHGEEAMAGAGVSLSALIREAAALNLGGIEALVGIPATVGRRPGHERRDRRRLRSATSSAPSTSCTPTARSASSSRAPGTFTPHRSTRRRGSVLIGCRLQLHRRPLAEIQKEIKQRLKVKKSTQPLALASAGCVWKNPPNDVAARLDREGRASRASGSTARRSPPSTPTSSSTAAERCAADILALHGAHARARARAPRHHARARDQDPR